MMKCLAIVTALVLVLLPHKIVMAQDHAGGTDVESALHALQETSGEDSVRALISLTMTPRTTLENLPELLAIARDAESTFDVQLNFGMFGRSPFWNDFQSQGAMILGRLANSVRYLDTEEERNRAVSLIRPLALSVLARDIPYIRLPEALESYFYSVFDPLTVAAPPPGSDIDELLTTLLNSFSHDSDLNMRVAGLLEKAAYLLPERRDEILDRLRAVIDVSEQEEVGTTVERLVRYEGEALSYTDYREILTKSDQEMLDFILAKRFCGNLRLAYFHVLTSRLNYSPDRSQILLRWASDESLRLRGLVVPSPISEVASKSDKELVDTIILFLEREITNSEGHAGWAVSGLKWMIYARENDPLFSSNGASWKPMEFRPYGRDRVVDVLMAALSAKDPGTREMAASALADVAWLGEDVARLVLDALLARKAGMDANPPAESLRLPGFSQAMIDGDIRKAKKALAAFEALGHKAAVRKLGMTVIPPPVKPSYAEPGPAPATVAVKPSEETEDAAATSRPANELPPEKKTTPQKDSNVEDGSNLMLVGIAVIVLSLVAGILYARSRNRGA